MLHSAQKVSSQTICKENLLLTNAISGLQIRNLEHHRSIWRKAYLLIPFGLPYLPNVWTPLSMFTFSMSKGFEHRLNGGVCLVVLIVKNVWKFQNMVQRLLKRAWDSWSFEVGEEQRTSCFYPILQNQESHCFWLIKECWHNAEVSSHNPFWRMFFTQF